MSRIRILVIAAILLPILIICMCPSSIASYIEFTGAELQSNPNNVKVIDNYAYCSYAYGLLILDISNPASPSLLGQVSYEGPGNGIVVIDEYAYIANGVYGLTIIDIREPAAPRTISNYIIPGNAVSIDVSGDYAYMATSDPSLSIIDISDKFNPALISTYDSSPYLSNDVVVNGDTVFYVGSYSYYEHNPGIFVILDVSARSNPILLWSRSTGGPLTSITISGNIAFITTTWAYFPPFEWDSGMLLYYIGTPDSLGLIGRLNYGSLWYFVDSYISGNYAYLANGDLHVADIANPANPTEVGFLDLPTAIGRIDIAGNTGCLVGENFYTIDLSNPVQPQISGTFSSSDKITKLCMDGNYAYLAAGDLNITDISNPARPLRIATFELEGAINDISAQAGYVYLSVDSSSLFVVDATNPHSPALNGSLSGRFRDISISGNYCFACGDDSLKVIDIANPFEPATIASLPGFGRNAEIAIRGNYAFVADTNFKVIDISNPSQPVLRVNLNVPGEGTQIAIVGDCAYINAGGLLAINISDPLHPSPGGSYQWVGWGADIAVDGCKAFVAEQNYIKILDITNPTSPSLLQNYRMSGNAKGIIANNELLYIAAYDAFLIYSYNAVSVNENDIVPSDFSISQNYPNPFNATTTIKYYLPVNGASALEIYNILGQEIARFDLSGQPAGEHSITWNAPDLPSGVYFARLVNGEKSNIIKMLLVK